ncbi:MAG TPA: thiamine-phosphate kinase [Thermoanaerobaculia bacterium]|nr:thiamine-phosphate kinase [Thermoanaerobaculia bacterium]
MNEDEIVRRLRQLFSPRIGDDAAVLGEDVVTTDMLVENVDFTRTTPARFIARKSLAVNLSDLAAMGARPAWALLALALPPWFMPELDAFLESLAAAAREQGVEIVGGDLSRSETLIVAITAAGRLSGRPLLRSGARPGEGIYLSRPVGGAAAGLALVRQGWSATGEAPREVVFAHREFALSAIRRHLDPEPETALGIALAGIAEVTACIDVSDGLSTDLHHLCEASQCGAEIERERIPLFPDLQGSAPALGIDVRDAVLHGGEEFALLFTSSLRESELSSRAGRPVYRIGRITAGRRVLILDGDEAKVLEPRGWDHFR